MHNNKLELEECNLLSSSLDSLKQRDVLIISPWVGKTWLCWVQTPHEASQSVHDTCQGIDDRASSLNRGSECGTGLRDGPAAVDDRSA